MRPYHERPTTIREQQTRESYRQGWGTDNPDRRDDYTPRPAGSSYPVADACNGVRLGAALRDEDVPPPFALDATERDNAYALCDRGTFRELIAAAWLQANPADKEIIGQAFPHCYRTWVLDEVGA